MEHLIVPNKKSNIFEMKNRKRFGLNETLSEVDDILEIYQKLPYHGNCYYGKW